MEQEHRQPRYPVPAGIVRVEEVIKRSRFITSLGPAGTVDEARAFINGVRAEYPDATHHCWAYLIGPPGSTSQVGMSDSGEPHGTAGRPMLNVLLHARAGDLVAVVSRYFGGTKLGKGGLVRAYAGGVQSALAVVGLHDKITWCELRLTLDYGSLEVFKRLGPDFEATIVGEEYSDQVTLTLRLPEEREATFRVAVTDRFAGKVVCQPFRR